jgi:hypothetical protein
MHPTIRDFLGAGMLVLVLFALVLMFYLAGFESV